MEGSTEIKGHHLDILFEKLSDDTKREITKAYQNAGGLERKEAFYIRGRLTGSNVDEAANTPARGTKLNQLLKNNKDIFVIFRYMFEKPVPRIGSIFSSSMKISMLQYQRWQLWLISS